jgi:hypothetical protein
MKHPHRRGHVPALNREQRAALLYQRIVKKKKQVTLAISFHISQSSVCRYIARAS